MRMFVTANHVRFPSSESLFQFSRVMWSRENHLTEPPFCHHSYICTIDMIMFNISASLRYPLISFPFPLAPFFFQAVILLLPCLYSCSSFAGIQCFRMFMTAMAIAYPEDNVSQRSSTFCSSYTFSVPSSKMVPQPWGLWYGYLIWS